MPQICLISISNPDAKLIPLRFLLIHNALLIKTTITNMPWLQFTLDVNPNQVPTIDNLFTTLGALAITYNDAGQESLFEPAPNEIKLWNLNRIIALFDANTDADLLATIIRANLPIELDTKLNYQLLKDQEWERVWLNNFSVKCFGKRLWICPNGQRPTQADAVIVDLDPGLAFGTGSHPTTAMCLEWLDQCDLNGYSVLDYGCGSGILAIAAAQLGAKFVTAVDYDPQALEATQANALNNNVAERLHICSPEAITTQYYDFVLANILAGTLITLEPQLAHFTRPGGHIILSGILDYQTSQVVNAYQHHFALNTPIQIQDWILLSGIRNDSIH